MAPTEHCVILAIQTVPIPYISVEGPVNLDHVSYFLSGIEIQVGDTPGMARWRKHLFIATTHLTADAAEYFGLPRHRTAIMGSRIQI